jgi:general secretion pathway protein K
VTIFNGSSNVDVTIASPEVVAAQSEKSSTGFGAANNASSLPSGLNENAGTLPNPDVASPKSGAFRASLQIKLRDGRRTTSEVVFALGGEDAPYRVLSWQDELTSGRQRKWARLK